MKVIKDTELQVSAVCFGSCPISLTAEEPEVFRLLDRFVDAGGNFIDTANVYGKWAPWFSNFSEQRLGRWLRTRKDRDKIVIATKGAHYDLENPNRIMRLGYEEILADAIESLKSLGLDTLPFYWLHRDDLSRPIGEILESCDRLRRQGYIRYLGASNFTAERLWQAREYAQQHGIPGFAAVSNQWSLATVNEGGNNNPDPTLVLQSEAEKKFHAQTGVTAIPFQSTARGWFAKAAAGQPIAPDVTRAFDNPVNRATLAELQRLAATTGHSVQALAVSQLTKVPFPVIPITSVSNDAQMDTLLEAMELLDD